VCIKYVYVHIFIYTTQCMISYTVLHASSMHALTTSETGLQFKHHVVLHIRNTSDFGTCKKVSHPHHSVIAEK